MIPIPVFPITVVKVYVEFKVRSRHKKITRSQKPHHIFHSRLDHLRLQVLNHVHHRHHLSVKAPQPLVLDCYITLKQPYVLLFFAMPLNVVLNRFCDHIFTGTFYYLLVDIHSHQQIDTFSPTHAQQQLSLRTPQLYHRANPMPLNDLTNSVVSPLVESHIQIGHYALPALKPLLLRHTLLFIRH